jgi:hypothetical protein
MAHTPPGFSGRRRVPVSLRSPGGRSFIADLEVQFLDGVPGGLVDAGRRFAFSHEVPAMWAEGSPARDDRIYVFNEVEPDATVG